MSDGTSPLPKGIQFLDSHGADFEELLWHFQIGAGDLVSAGRFAILPYDSFTQFNIRLRDAERLLHSLLLVGPLSPKHKEMVERFFDPGASRMNANAALDSAIVK